MVAREHRDAEITVTSSVVLADVKVASRICYEGVDVPKPHRRTRCSILLDDYPGITVNRLTVAVLGAVEALGQSWRDRARDGKHAPGGVAPYQDTNSSTAEDPTPQQPRTRRRRLRLVGHTVPLPCALQSAPSAVCDRACAPYSSSSQ